MQENQDIPEFKDARKRAKERGTADSREKEFTDKSLSTVSGIQIVNEDELPETISHDGDKKLFVFEMIDTIIEVALLLIVFLSLQYFIVSPFVVSGASMEDSFQNQELIIVNRIGYANFFGAMLTPPTRGDVIVFHPPIETKEYYIKRIIGIPGDTVSFKNNNVYLNGKLLDEPYTKCIAQHLANDLSSRERGICNYTFMEGKAFTVPEGSYFAMGDNRDHSSDSRTCFGIPNDRACSLETPVHFVPKKNIVGKAWFVFWPFSQKAAHIRKSTFLEMLWPLDNIELVKEYKTTL